MRIAVLGAGYAGITLVRELGRRLPEDVELVLVDDTGDHLVQHELHRLIRYPDLAEHVVLPLDEIVTRAEVRVATVTDVDPDAGEATLDGRETLPYDVGAVCLGAQTNFYDVPGLAEFGTPLKRRSHAESIRADFRDVLADEGTVVVGGAGLSGVQVAGELAAYADGEDADVHVVLLEQEATVAPAFPERFRRAVRDELEARDVDVRTSTHVTRATADRIETRLAGDVPYDQFVWTGGIRGPDALDGSRPQVRANLRLRGRTFVVGDAGFVIDADGERVPASAQAAIREAAVVAESVERLVDHRDDGPGAFDPRPASFAFDPPGWVVSVGDGAVAQIGPKTFTGGTAVAVKAAIGARHLTTVGRVRDAVDYVNEELGLARVAEEEDEEFDVPIE